MKSKRYYFFRSKPWAFNAQRYAERIRSNSALQKYFNENTWKHKSFRRKNILSKVPQALCFLLIFLMLILLWRFSLAACVSFAPQSFLIRTSAYGLTRKALI